MLNIIARYAYLFEVLSVQTPLQLWFYFSTAVEWFKKQPYDSLLDFSSFSSDDQELQQLSFRSSFGKRNFHSASKLICFLRPFLLSNIHLQEITTGPAPHLVYRTIGGILDIYFFPGPEPEQVVQQYLALIGTPILPAYFALGFQVAFCSS